MGTKLILDKICIAMHKNPKINIDIYRKGDRIVNVTCKT